MQTSRLRVGVLFGGRSGEHEVSLRSARSIIEAMDRQQYEIIPIAIDKFGRWFTCTDPFKMLEEGIALIGEPVALLAEPRGGELLPIGKGSTHSALPAVHIFRIDVLFPVLHGPLGEDGTVQGLLELADVPYVGAGVLGSALGMDKALAKDVFRSHGLPIVRHVTLKRREWFAEPAKVIEHVERELGYDCFVKPACLGSSVGISKAHNRRELEAGLQLASQYDRKIVVEEAIAAREIEISVLGNEDPIASVPGEIIPCREFYDYRAKYIEDGSQLLIPAPISRDLADEMRDIALKAFRALDCAGMARVDFLLDRNTGRFYLNEINTIPGFTTISMYPKLWEASGITFSELIDRLIDLALERHADRNRSLTSYDPALEWADEGRSGV